VRIAELRRRAVNADPDRRAERPERCQRLFRRRGFNSWTRAASAIQRVHDGPSFASTEQKETIKRMLLQNAVADALNNTEWAFALAECVHIGGFAVAIGSIALVDFRMLNLGLRSESAARVLRHTELWTLIALLFVVFSGAALFLSQADIYRVNLIFPLKMCALAAALIYNFTVHRKVATMENPPPVLSKSVAIVSLLLWVSVVFGGIFTGFLV
jgi:hypothetical protein